MDCEDGECIGGEYGANVEVIGRCLSVGVGVKWS